MTGFNNMQQMGGDNYEGYLKGVVVFNDDPDRRQRIKVTIPKVMEGDVNTLPWIMPIVQSDFGITANAGTINVPAVGSVVQIEFQEGNIHYGLCGGSMHTADWTPPAELLTNYPNRRGWKDPAGILHWIDDTPGQVGIKLAMPSGTTILIDNAGQLTINVASHENITVNGNATLNATGNVNVSAGGNVTVNAGGNADVIAGGDANIRGSTVNLN